MLRNKESKKLHHLASQSFSSKKGIVNLLNFSSPSIKKGDSYLTDFLYRSYTFVRSITFGKKPTRDLKKDYLQIDGYSRKDSKYT